MRLLLLIVLIVFAAGHVYGQPVVLKCMTDTGQETVNLAIDLKSKTLKWGATTYDIIGVTDNYISAYQRPFADVGGEIWVINRNTGYYKRGSVGMTFSEGETEAQARLTGDVYSGRCVKQQF